MRAEKKAVELTEEEKAIIELLSKNHPASLPELKVQSGLSGKKWDISIKGLTLSSVFSNDKDSYRKRAWL
jgi:lysyl-tRNA synthetase class 2